MKREKLPKDYENRYKSERLKEKIADDGMWLRTLVPDPIKEDVMSSGT